MPNKDIEKYRKIISYFEGFTNPDPACDGLERFLSENGKIEVFERLKDEHDLQLNKVQFNQLLILSGLTSITFGFFKYYWLCLPSDTHPHNITGIKGHEDDFDPEFFIESDPSDYLVFVLKESNSEQNQLQKIYTRDQSIYFRKTASDNYVEIASNTNLSLYRPVSNTVIKSLKHLRWGLRRIYIDTLFYFGNITIGFTTLGRMNENDLREFFRKQCFNIELIKERGHSLDFIDIPETDRYLISEMACQNLSSEAGGVSRLETILKSRFGEARIVGIERIKVDILLAKDRSIIKKDEARNGTSPSRKTQITLDLDIEISTSDILNEVVGSVEDIERILSKLTERFNIARRSALHNTRLYLSLVNDMDVYVATSMRNKEDFLKMASNCKEIFKGFPEISKLNLRYFDPTMSAAEGHEDKGIIECLMVKCAKVLIYTSGDKDSYGKDAEAAMALSSGKPVIFLCNHTTRNELFKDVHPLSKLIDFKTGVANGAMIAEDNKQVADLLKQIFNNDMEYELQREIEKSPDETHDKAYFRLVDRLTKSTVRIQTSDLFLSKGFWNYFSHHVRQ